MKREKVSYQIFMGKKLLDEVFGELFDAVQTMALAVKHLHQGNYLNRWERTEHPRKIRPKKAFSLRVVFPSGKRISLSLGDAMGLLSVKERGLVWNMIQVKFSEQCFTG